MKFSYALLKKLVPAIKSPQQLADILTMHLFEVESVEGDTLDVKVLANRYSDAASYWGLARIIAAIYNAKPKIPSGKVVRVEIKRKVPVTIKSPLCRRTAARYIEGVKIDQSPKWLQDALAASGIRSINNLVDITNYVTLETGQPLHAFDFEKMEGGMLMVRSAEKRESLEILDGRKLVLSGGMLVLADKKTALDVAGVKGGKKAEITHATKNILLTACNFDGTNIYKTSHALNLVTDASLRFSHHLSPALVQAGIARATELIKELCGGRAGEFVDVYPKKETSKVLKFDMQRFNQLTGLDLSEKFCLDYLRKLGFVIRGKLVTVPPERTDIDIFEDLVEEIMALHGYDKVPTAPPRIHVRTPDDEPLIHLKERIRRILPGVGLSEVYNYSLVNQGMVELENPIAEDKKYLRASLLPSLAKNVLANSRFFDVIRIFEVGTVFKKEGEEIKLGIALADKKGMPVLELKGVIEKLFELLYGGRVIFPPDGKAALSVECEGRSVGGITLIRAEDMRTALAELDVEALHALARDDRSFASLPKYPALDRDLSIVVKRSFRTGDILEAVLNVSGGLLPEGVEVIDFYEGPKIGEENQGLTLRLRFRASDRTLTDEEADEELQKIVAVVAEQFQAKIR